MHAGGGEVLFNHLTIGRVFARTCNLFVDRWNVYMILSVLVVLPTAILGSLIGAIFGRSIVEKVMKTKSTNCRDGDPALCTGLEHFTALLHHSFSVVLIIVLQWVLATAITLIGAAAMTRACADTYAAQPQSWRACWKIGLDQLRTLVVASMIRVGVAISGWLIFAVFIGMAVATESIFFVLLALIVFGMVSLALLYFLLSIVLVIPVIVVESKGPVEALQRSYEMSKGRQSYVFCALFIMWIVRLIVEQLLHNIFNASGSLNQSLPLANFLTPGGIFVSHLPDLLYLPLSCILTFVLYASIRVDKEGFTPDVLQRELVQPTAYTAPSSSALSSPPNLNYRHVPLVEEADETAENNGGIHNSNHNYSINDDNDNAEEVVVQGTMTDFV